MIIVLWFKKKKKKSPYSYELYAEIFGGKISKCLKLSNNVSRINMMYTYINVCTFI